MGWYNTIAKPGGLSNLPQCMSYYEKELIDARKELSMDGIKLETVHRRLPGIFEYRYGQLQEVEAILEHLNIELRKVKSTVFQKYQNQFNRSLTSRDAEKYTEGDSTYVNMAILVNDFALIRNRYLAVMKGLEQVSWQSSNVNRLRVNGIDDAMLD